MARVTQLQLLRGTLAAIPVLGDAEFYLATDTYQLFVGLSGNNLPIGAAMSVQVQGPTGNILQPATDGSIGVSLSSSIGKNTILKTGQLTTTSTTANQVILTYTVTAGKTLFLEYLDLQGRFTTPSSIATILGNVQLLINGLAIYTATFVNPTTSDSGSQAVRISVGEPLPLVAGTIISFVVTPVTTTSILWLSNFGAYEK